MIAAHLILGAFNACFAGYNARHRKPWWAGLSALALTLNGFGVWAHSA